MNGSYMADNPPGQKHKGQAKSAFGIYDGIGSGRKYNQKKEIKDEAQAGKKLINQGIAKKIEEKRRQKALLPCFGLFGVKEKHIPLL
jgi:hypothetical protein